MRRVPSLVGVLAFAAVLASGGASRADERAVVLTFTPTDRSQIAIWIESADGTFLSTVGLTQAVGVRGIGNRPGAAQMNSGYHWPYGRREGVLPVWASRRAAAPGAGQFPRVVFQDRPEGYASRNCADSTNDSYFCLSFMAETTRRDQLDVVTCASPTAFQSDKGRFLKPADIAAGYSEPLAVGGPGAWQLGDRPLSLTSLYPPRHDFTSCANASTVSPCVGGTGSDGCYDHADTAMYADAARMAMPDIDAVSMATPPAGLEQTVMFSVPGSWPDGDYVAYLEINTEGDYNSTYNDSTYPTPCAPWDSCPRGDVWDYWAVNYGYPYRGQPSVVFAVPFTLGQAGNFSALMPVGFGSIDGTDANPGAMHKMDPTISDDAQGAPGSGADRLQIGTTQTSRLEVEVRPCLSGGLPGAGAPTDVTAAPVMDPAHSHQWAHLHFLVPDNQSGIARYEVRTSTDPNPIVVGDDTSFIHGIPAQAASTKTEALVIPTDGAPGTPVDVDFGGLSPLTHYYVGVRAIDGCNRAGPHAVAELTTTKINFVKLPPVSLTKAQCFIATAAWGSGMEPTVVAMRRARDQLLAEVPLFSVAADLYGRSGPAAAGVLRRSDTARVLARQMLGPLATTAEALTPAKKR